MFGNKNTTQLRREVRVLPPVLANLIRPLRGRGTRRGRLRLVHGRWDPEPDPAERHSARLALAA